MIEPLKTEESYFGGKMEMIVCPICLEGYTHTDTPTIVIGKDYEVWQGRGGMVCIPMDCEHGHAFDICIGHHKGNSHIYIQYKEQV